MPPAECHPMFHPFPDALWTFWYCPSAHRPSAFPSPASKQQSYPQWDKSALVHARCEFQTFSLSDSCFTLLFLSLFLLSSLQALLFMPKLHSYSYTILLILTLTRILFNDFINFLHFVHIRAIVSKASQWHNSSYYGKLSKLHKKLVLFTSCPHYPHRFRQKCRKVMHTPPCPF